MIDPHHSSRARVNPRYRYQLTHSFADRRRETASMRHRYPQCVPVVCEPDMGIAPSDAGLLTGRHRLQRELDRAKFLVPTEASIQQLLLLLRSRLLLEAEQAVFLFVDNELPPSCACIGDIYAQRKDDDGFLYMTYSIESTYGAKLPRGHAPWM
ncbi:Atg8-like protein 2 [Trypanosoma grayi]|uniref:Atg8-like protein 2 n=1 Tax=Trypanosoma grayi TaxID=71804 RepID=UPI0004F45D54|nr:Atg8-like protein 2 [Trypanosoma grayi]KEG10648.1 Atg8-like protein 2 [Trypanosoma grayi]